MQGPPCRSVSGGCPVEILATTDREWVLAEAIGCRSTSTVRAFVWQRRTILYRKVTSPRTAKANKRQEKPYRQRHFGRLAELGNSHL